MTQLNSGELCQTATPNTRGPSKTTELPGTTCMNFTSMLGRYVSQYLKRTSEREGAFPNVTHWPRNVQRDSTVFNGEIEFAQNQIEIQEKANEELKTKDWHTACEKVMTRRVMRQLYAGQIAWLCDFYRIGVTKQFQRIGDKKCFG